MLQILYYKSYVTNLMLHKNPDTWKRKGVFGSQTCQISDSCFLLELYRPSQTLQACMPEGSTKRLFTSSVSWLFLKLCTDLTEHACTKTMKEASCLKTLNSFK